MIIGRKWSALVKHTGEVLQDKVDKNEVTSDGFQLFLGSLYTCEGKMDGQQFVEKLFKSSSNVIEMFKALTVECAWDFINYYFLESIIDEYGDDKTLEMMEQYQQDLNGYTLVTKIKDHLVACNLQDLMSTELPNPCNVEFSKLKRKIGINITEHSLKFVMSLWKYIQRRFSLPGHILVLHRMDDGCLEITWCIPSEITAYFIEEEQQFLKDGVHEYTEIEADIDMVSFSLNWYNHTSLHTPSSLMAFPHCPDLMSVSAKHM